MCIIYIYRIRNDENTIYFDDYTVEQDVIDTIIENNITPNMSEYEKVKAIHDYIVSTTTYDSKNLENNTIPDIDYTAKGVLENNIGVCRGYAEAFKLLMNNLDIDCEIQTGYADSISHAWNIVKIDNEWYQIDCTYDDPVRTNGKPVDVIRYDYFLVTSQQMYIDHKPDEPNYTCISDKYMYQEKEYGVPYCILPSVSMISNSVTYTYSQGNSAMTYYFPEDIGNELNSYMTQVSQSLAGSSAKQFSYSPVAKCGKYYYTTIYINR